MITLLQVLSDSNLGGAGRVLSNYIAAYDSSVFQLHIALPCGSVLLDTFAQEGVHLHAVEGMADRSYHKEDVKAIRRLIQEVQPDIVHTHGAFSGRVAAKLEKVPVVYSRHSVFPVSWKGKLLAPILGPVNCYFSDGIIAVSPAAVDNLVETGVPSGKITTIFNGIQPVTRSNDQAQQALKAELGLGDGFVFGILARLEYYKGHSMLLDACALLKARGHDFHLLIAGTGQESQAIQEKIKALDLGEQVKFLGFWSEVSALLSILDAQLNCSFGTEATSIALLEGMSMGLPSVVSDYGGNPYVVEEGETGLLFPSCQVPDLAAAMEKILGDPALQQRCQTGAKKLFQEKFTAQAFARETEAFYQSILSRYQENKGE